MLAPTRTVWAYGPIGSAFAINGTYHALGILIVAIIVAIWR